jgi:hypothetical protein
MTIQEEYYNLCKRFDIKPFPIGEDGTLRRAIECHWSMMTDFATQLDNLLKKKKD